MGAPAHKGIKRVSKTTTRKSRVVLAETSSHQLCLIFQLSLQAEQITWANEGKGGETTSVPQAALGDEEVQDTHMIPQAATRSRSKGRIVNIDPSQNEGVKKTKILSRNSWLKRDFSPGRHNHFKTEKQILGGKN